MAGRMAALDLDLLRSFVAVAESGGFGRAARRLNCTQSTVSLHMRRLELAAGARLIERGPRLFALTEAGRVLLDDARRLLALHDETLARLQRSALSGALTVGVSEELAGRQLPRILADFGLKHPGVRLAVRCGLSGPMRVLLKRGEIDLLIARRPAGTRDGGSTLWREGLVWTSGPGNPAADAVLPLAVCGEGCLYRAQALAALRRARRRWRIVYTAASLPGVQTAVGAGLGITALGRSGVLPGMRVLGAGDRLPALPETEIALYCRARPGAPVRALAQMIQERFAPPLAEAAD